MSCEQKTCLVQKQVQLAFHQFQLIVQIRAWKLKQGKENDVLTQVQELFCLRELVKSSNPRSDPETAKKPFFLKRHLKTWLLSLWRVGQLDTSWYKLDTSWYYDTGWHRVDNAPAPSRWWVVTLAQQHFVKILLLPVGSLCQWFDLRLQSWLFTGKLRRTSALRGPAC